VKAGQAHGVVVGVDRLDQHNTGKGSATGAARHLSQDLKGAFGGAEIGHAEADIGGDYAD